MNIKTYITSGILEDYILGIASLNKCKEVEYYIQKYPEIRSEIRAIEDALILYTQAKALPMPKGLDQEIFSCINQLST